MSKHNNGLWHHPGFLLLWSGQTISQIGSQVTLWGLPLVAILLLKITPFQMGILALMGRLPLLLIGIVAGAWVDRMSHRLVLIMTDIGRALLIGSIPIAAWQHTLSLMQLYVVAFLVGVLTIFFDVAYQSFLPSLITHDQLVSANSKLESSTALATIIGPGLAGTLIQLVSGPLAILADAISFIISAASLASIHMQKISYNARTEPHKLVAEIGDGIRFVWQNPIIRTLAISSAIFNLFDTMMGAEYVLYLTRTLGMGAVFVGLVGALGGVGWLLGALVTQPLTQRLGVGTALIGSIFLACIAKVSIAVANGPFLLALSLVICGEFLFQGVATVYVITSTSLRQAAVPPDLRGRVAAIVRVVSWGIGSLGALLGGVLAERFDLRTAMVIAAVGTALALIWIMHSPVPRIQSL